MAGFLLRRIVHSVPVLLGVTIVVFAMMHLAPGDPAQAMLGPMATPENLAKIRHDLGLDRPLYAQYVTWVTHAMRGDFGDSIKMAAPVRTEVIDRFGASLLLGGASFVIAILVGIPAGVLSALKRGSVFDRLIMLVMMAGISMPPFYLGMLLIVGFAFKVDIFPMSGMYSTEGYGGIGDVLSHLVLPALTLSAASTTVIARMTRSSVLEVINEDYVRTARSKGLAEQAVVLRHVLKNALIPVINLLGLQIGFLLSATALVEVVFSWPGLGQLLVASVLARDLPMLQGGVFVIALVYVVTNIVTDTVHAAVDPRLHLS
ncbi:MAG: ABC transporter permease [Chloroflexota bacterium]|nr:ABC transporter permease [Chloroflexota bacterium]